MVATSFITRAFALTALLVSSTCLPSLYFNHNELTVYCSLALSVAYAAPTPALSPLDASLSVPADKRFCRICLIADDGAHLVLVQQRLTSSNSRFSIYDTLLE
ncbi:hypothetical protein C2E23DRAFT_556027 [Lenzites betulinus]|nr:hypothetical protein C2E23DRAFT_556027 [Lenzites betulinus]